MIVDLEGEQVTNELDLIFNYFQNRILLISLESLMLTLDMFFSKQKKLNKFLIIFLATSLLSCSPVRRMENKLSGMWVIEKSIVNGRDNLFDYLTNSIVLYSNRTCELPIINWDNINRSSRINGSWKVTKKASQYFIKLTTENSLFDKKFKLNYSTRKHGYATLKVIELKADSIYIRCTQ